MASGTRGEDTDLTSPELVLVSDAELAQQARDELPPRDGGTAQGDSERPARTVEPPPYPSFASEEPPSPLPRRRPARRRSRRLVPLAALLVLVAVAVIGWLVLRNSDDNSPPSSSASPPGAPAAFVPARTWVWGASKGARGYVFQMFLNGKVVVSAQTKQPRYELPSSFKFRAGKYRWTVHRLPKPADGGLVSDSKFVLTPELAAQANR